MPSRTRIRPSGGPPRRPSRERPTPACKRVPSALKNASEPPPCDMSFPPVFSPTNTLPSPHPALPCHVWRRPRRPHPRPRRLASASLSGGALSFASEALEEGRVAKAVEVRSDDGTFIFDIDRYYSGLSIIDTSNTAFFWACIVALYLAAAVAARVLLISPLESMLSALTSAASVLDDDGVPVDSSSGIPGHKTPPNLEATVRRLLALVSRVTRSDATGRGDSFLERFGGIRVSDKEAGDEEGSVIGRRFRSGTESGDGSPRAGKLVDDGASKALARMRFPPAVLNGLGTPMWKPGRLCQETMVSACHLMFVKSRIPESLCSRGECESRRAVLAGSATSRKHRGGACSGNGRAPRSTTSWTRVLCGWHALTAARIAPSLIGAIPRSARRSVRGVDQQPPPDASRPALPQLPVRPRPPSRLHLHARHFSLLVLRHAARASRRREKKKKATPHAVPY